METAWEATIGSEEVEEDLDLAEVVVGGGPDLLEVRSTNKSLMNLHAMQITALLGIFLLLPALNCSFFQLVEVVEDPLVPTLGGDRNNQNRTAEKNCGA